MYLCMLPASLVFFGILFVITGFSRLSRVSTDPNKREALLWGTIGLVLGALCFVAAVVFALWEPQDPRLR